MDETKGLQVIFGAGPVGVAAATYLLDNGLRVRLVNRSGNTGDARIADLPDEKRERLSVVAADAMDAAQVLAATDGATHIYHCAHVSYEKWGALLPFMHANLVEAAVARKATLAVAENLYMYAADARTISERTAETPPSRKGRLQQELHCRLVEAGNSRGLHWVSVRASDFYGPGSVLQSVFGTERFLDPLYAGKRPGLLGNVDLPHTFTFVGDYGRALAVAAHAPGSLGRAWIVPNDRTLTTRQVAELFFEAAGKSPGVWKIPRALITILGFVNPVIRELGEVLYQKERPYVVDGSLFASHFEFVPTKLEDGIRATLEWYDRRRGTSAVEKSVA